MDAPQADLPNAAHVTVVATLVNGDPASVAAAATCLNAADVAVVQHEYGIYGGPDGDEVLDLMAQLHVPIIAVLHTVLDRPHAHQKHVIEEVMRRADVSVVMSQAGLDLIRDTYDADISRVVLIPHGVAPVTGVLETSEDAPIVLTWGIIGPGKGIEWGIKAMAHLSDLSARPTYRVVGSTHPKVLAHAGETYRTSLIEGARRLGVEGTVEFYGEYLTREELSRHVRAASLVLLPYDSTTQVTSGVLAEAVASGIPVVATAFPHAVELLANGAGIVVPHRDPVAMARAIRWILAHPDDAQEMSRVGMAWGAQTHWPAVGARYRAIASKIAKVAAA
ncbi:glycosyltransferase [Demequina sp.]|uniref:glycosyltransferase n=1 Tax=Demequina sp. TaxID=2050685 RepID=UPI0025BFD14F|nr:glycosyltransferase [Demequina sp.]